MSALLEVKPQYIMELLLHSAIRARAWGASLPTTPKLNTSNVPSPRANEKFLSNNRLNEIVMLGSFLLLSVL
jgi:hypothetical protein